MLSFILFADDSNIFFSHNNANHLLRSINVELKNVTDWIKANKLSLNLQKTNYMLFSNKIDNLRGEIIFDNTVLDKVSTTKFLGVFIDHKLSWKTQIDNVCKTISRNIGVINKLKYFLPSCTLVTLYHTLLLPYINYAIIAWGCAIQSQINRILLLQKKALRVIFQTQYRSHTDILFYENNILKVKDIYFFQLGQFMFKLSKGDLPEIFSDMFSTNASVHNYPTRQRNCYHLPLTRTSLAQKSFIFSGCAYWNSLPNDIKDAPSLSTFKRKLKKVLLGQYIPQQQT